MKRSTVWMMGVAGSLIVAAGAQAGWGISIGAGIAFGGSCGWGGWGGPYISIGTGWSSGCGPRYYDDCRPYDYYRPYSPPQYYGPRYCAPTYEPSYKAPLYGDPVYAGPAHAAPSQERMQVAQAPRPAAPVVLAESNTARGWRLLESGSPGAMEAFGKAVARRESADAYLGYSICAANAGQADRAEWAAQSAVRKDARVLAKAPAGEGVRAAAREALSRYGTVASANGKAGQATVAMLSGVAGVTAQARLDEEAIEQIKPAKTPAPAAPKSPATAVGEARLASATPPARPAVSAAAPVIQPVRAGATDSPEVLPARRVVVAVKPDAK
jgi:hypothetical protein